jgi:hypothetical protein
MRTDHAGNSESPLPNKIVANSQGLMYHAHGRISLFTFEPRCLRYTCWMNWESRYLSWPGKLIIALVAIGFAFHPSTTLVYLGLLLSHSVLACFYLDLTLMITNALPCRFPQIPSSKLCCFWVFLRRMIIDYDSRCRTVGTQSP